jgi:hypothetical protein
VTSENFANMYENVYDTMVEAGIAKVVDDAIQQAGLPTKYKLTRPDFSYSLMRLGVTPIS